MNGRAGPGPTLRAKALAWLAQREHSRQELRGKLQRWAGEQPEVHGCGEPAAIESLLDALEASRLLCDARFAESRVHLRSSRYGSRRIEQELQRQGVRLDDQQRGQLRATELERARQVWARRFANAPSTPADRARQVRFLAGRGFELAIIHRLLREAGDAGMPDSQAPHSDDA